MTLKEAILKSLEELKSPVTHKMVYRYIVDKQYYNFYESKTPKASVSSALGDLIRNKNKIIIREKREDNTYEYSLKRSSNA